MEDGVAVDLPQRLGSTREHEVRLAVPGQTRRIGIAGHELLERTDEIAQRIDAGRAAAGGIHEGVRRADDGPAACLARQVGVHELGLNEDIGKLPPAAQVEVDDARPQHREMPERALSDAVDDELRPERGDAVCAGSERVVGDGGHVAERQHLDAAEHRAVFQVLEPRAVRRRLADRRPAELPATTLA